MARISRRRLPPAAGLTSEERLVHEDFARRLYEAMSRKKFSQSDLAREVWGSMEVVDKLGRTSNVARNRDRISVYLRGAGLPDPKNLSLIAQALGTTPEDLAPEITGAAVEREAPSMSMTAVAGHEDKVMLRINKLVPLATAMQVLNILAKE